MNKVSVIINSFNESELKFRTTIDSVLSSIGVEVQIILSTVKGDPSIVWAKDYDFDVVINETPGIFKQINSAIEKVQGDFVTYFSSNDIMHSFKLKIESELLKKYNKKVCYSSFYRTDITGVRSIKNFHDYDYKKHLVGNFVSDCAMVEIETFLKYTPFKVEYGNHSYHDLWLRIYKGEGNVFIYNPIATWEYVVTENSSHYKRSKDLKKHRENEDSRKKMLNNHI